MEKKKVNTLSIAEKVLAILFGIIIITMFSQVVFRYLFNQSLYWSEEIVRYLFVWFVFIGGAAVIRDGNHIGIDFLLMKIPVRISSIIRVINSILMLLVNLFFIVAGVFWVIKSKGSTSPALGLPINWFLYASLPAASVIAVYLNIKRIFKLHNSDIKPTHSKEANIL